MLLEVKIKLTSPFLGDVHSKEKIRRLKKNGNGNIVINEAQWLDTFALGAKQLNIPFDKATIMLEEDFEAPSIHLYRRVWLKTRSEMFESIRKGTEITFQMILRDDLENCPTIEQLVAIFELVGKFFGLSQWGSGKFGYGRFKLQYIKKVVI